MEREDEVDDEDDISLASSDLSNEEKSDDGKTPQDIEENEEIAKKKQKIKNVRNYYVLTLMMVGVIDDFKDALNELLRAANLPISVIVIKMGKNSEDNDSTKFIK